jgi:hypothetical protein
MKTADLAPFAGVYQVAYVTSDLNRAMQQFATSHGVKKFMEMRPTRYATGPGKEAVCNIAMAYAGAVELEIIEPLEGDVQLYRDFLPPDGRFAVRFHHIATLFESLDALEAQLTAHRSAGVRIPLDGAAPGSARYFYADFREQLGHYVESIYFEPQARSFLEAIPRS